MEVQDIDIDLIHKGEYQPRIDFNENELQELADSIKQNELVQPIVVRSDLGGGFEIVAGERRWRACQLLGHQQIPTIIKKYSDRAAAEIALIENNQRSDLNPIEEAKAIKRLLDEFGMTQMDVAVSLGKPRTQIANAVRLLNLHEDVQQLLREDTGFTSGHAKVLCALNHSQQKVLSRRVVRQKLSVRQLERIVNKQAKEQPQKAEVDPDMSHLEELISEQLAAPVEIKINKEGEGYLKIKFFNTDGFEGVCEKCGLNTTDM